MNSLGSTHINTEPYHPEGNGTCEPFNKYVKLFMQEIIATHPNLSLGNTINGNDEL